jgi:hypothetical protein
MLNVGINRVLIATDAFDRTSGSLTDRLDIPFGDVLTLTEETSAGENDPESVIDCVGIGIDVVQPADRDGNNVA